MVLPLSASRFFNGIFKMKLKHLISVLSLALSCLCMNTALAHGAAKAQHGGIV